MNGYLVDTNILSELTRLSPEPQVETFLHKSKTRVFVSVLSIGETRKGIAALPMSKKRACGEQESPTFPSTHSRRCLEKLVCAHILHPASAGNFRSHGAFLGIIGIYGVLAHAAGQRRREVSIRLALGAEPKGIKRMFVRYGLLLAFVLQ